MAKKRVRTVATRWEKKGRQLTVYFSTKQEKETFDRLAKGFGMSSSTLGTICIHAGMRDGFRALSGEHELVVHSESSVPPITEAEQPKRPRLFDRLQRLLGRSA